MIHQKYHARSAPEDTLRRMPSLCRHRESCPISLLPTSAALKETTPNTSQPTRRLPENPSCLCRVPREKRPDHDLYHTKLQEYRRRQTNHFSILVSIRAKHIQTRQPNFDFL